MWTIVRTGEDHDDVFDDYEINRDGTQIRHVLTQHLLYLDLNTNNQIVVRIPQTQILTPEGLFTASTMPLYNTAAVVLPSQYPWGRVIQSYRTVSVAQIMLWSWVGAPPIQLSLHYPHNVKRFRPAYRNSNPYDLRLLNLEWETQPYGNTLSHNSLWWNTFGGGNPMNYSHKLYQVHNIQALPQQSVYLWGKYAVLYYILTNTMGLPLNLISQYWRRTIVANWGASIQQLNVNEFIDVQQEANVYFNETIVFRVRRILSTVENVDRNEQWLEFDRDSRGLVRYVSQYGRLKLQKLLTGGDETLFYPDRWTQMVRFQSDSNPVLKVPPVKLTMPLPNPLPIQLLSENINRAHPRTFQLRSFRLDALVIRMFAWNEFNRLLNQVTQSNEPVVLVLHHWNNTPSDCRLSNLTYITRPWDNIVFNNPLITWEEYQLRRQYMTMKKDIAVQSRTQYLV